MQPRFFSPPLSTPTVASQVREPHTHRQPHADRDRQPDPEPHPYPKPQWDGELDCVTLRHTDLRVHADEHSVSFAGLDPHGHGVCDPHGLWHCVRNGECDEQQVRDECRGRGSEGHHRLPTMTPMGVLLARCRRTAGTAG